jgi:sugar/nucleoside kinase (ribokinase family)
MYKLITIGDAVLDTHVQIDSASVECDIRHTECKLCLDYASKIPITDSFQALGGNASNVAAGAVKLGLKTAIISSVGNDSNGKLILSELKNQKVDTSLIDMDDKVKTRYSIVLTYKGERTILSYHQKRKYSWPKDLPETDWLYFTSMSEGFETTQDKMMSYLEKHPSVRLASNPGSFQLKNSLDKVRELLPYMNILILNLEEAEQILGTTIEKEKSMSAIIHEMIMKGPKEVAITDAGRGAWAGTESNIWHLDSFPVEVVAKTGAGDAFSSGYLAARIYGHDIATSLSWGISNSCSVITAYGAQKNLLDKNGINKMITRYGKIKPQRV